jgi:parvulin-like peptidyl-prolyl isomerase
MGLHPLLATLAAAGLLAAGACRSSPQTGLSPILATVLDEPITVEDFHTALERHGRDGRLEPAGADAQAIAELKLNLLNQLIEERLLLAEARRLKLNPSPSELTAAVERIKNDYSEQGFEDYLRERGITYDVWVEQLRRDLTLRKVIQQSVDNKVAVKAEEIETYYRAHPDEFQQPEQVHARQIVVATEEEAHRLHAQLTGPDAATTSFEELASDYSLSPDRAQGGDLGFFARGELPEEFDVIFELEPGSISRVVKSPYGYHVFKLLERRLKRTLGPDEATIAIRDRLVQTRREERFAEWLETLKRKANIKTNIEILNDTPLVASAPGAER